MKIYIAARFSKRHDAHNLGVALRVLGHTIVSRWSLPDSDHVKPVGLSEQAADKERERFATEDLEDIEACDWCVSLMETPRNDSRGGRHVEFGYAMALKKKLIIIGPKETVFHNLPQVKHYKTVPEFLEWAVDE